MNTNDGREGAHDMLPDDLRWRLRGLRREESPERDLWPDISARLAASAAAPANSRGRRRIVRRRSTAWFVTAAALVVAVAIGWQLRPAPDPAPVAPPATPIVAVDDTPMLLRLADAMALEYQAAVREVEGTGPRIGDAGALAQLDRSAAEIHAALALDPDARFLFERLRRVYAQRLALTRRLT